jgi:hypothetical protein
MFICRRRFEQESLSDALPHADVLYVTRVQKERFATPEDYDAVKGMCTHAPPTPRPRRAHAATGRPARTGTFARAHARASVRGHANPTRSAPCTSTDGAALPSGWGARAGGRVHERMAARGGSLPSSGPCVRMALPPRVSEQRASADVVASAACAQM